jgi:hypothetical protein
LVLPFGLAVAACDPSTVTADEVVPIYESPCEVYDVAGSAEGGTTTGTCGTPDSNGSYVEAWSSLPCMDVCSALNTSEPHALIACGPIHAETEGGHAGFMVVTCVFDGENQ